MFARSKNRDVGLACHLPTWLVGWNGGLAGGAGEIWMAHRGRVGGLTFLESATALRSPSAIIATSHRQRGNKSPWWDLVRPQLLPSDPNRAGRACMARRPLVMVVGSLRRKIYTGFQLLSHQKSVVGSGSPAVTAI